MFGLCKSTELHRREALSLILEGYILLINMTIKYVVQAYGEEVSHDFSHHQVQPSSRMPPKDQFFPSFIIVVVAKPYADTRDKSGKNAYTVKIEVKK
jgi:hypothetical protein